MKKSLLIILTILLLTSLACSFSINVPRVETTDTQTMNISEPAPDGNGPGDIEIAMGGGRLAISGGANQWVEGKVDYNVLIWEPDVTRFNDSLEINQDTKENIGLPDNKVINDWDLKLGNFPTNLIIKAGAYQGELDLSGVPLTNLEISDGASQADIIFDQVNPVVMNDFVYKTGASQINMEGLSNANFEEFSFEGGAGSYTLDFSGDLQRDARINITYGLGDVKIIIPSGYAARITVEGGLNNVNLSGTWNVDGNEYRNNGTGPLLDFRVKLGLGNLRLVNQ